MADPLDNALRSPYVLTGLEPLRVLGTSVTQMQSVKAAAEADLGIELDFITLDGAAAQRRCALQPLSFDVYDQWFHDLDLVWPTGSLQPIKVSRLLSWENISGLPKIGQIGQNFNIVFGVDPSERLYVQLDGRLSKTPSSLISMVPTVHNSDGFAVVGNDIDATSWATLLDPNFSGRVILQSDPAIGALDILLALKANGEMSPKNIADLTLEEVDELVEHLARYRLSGQFHTIWNDEAEAVDALQDGKSIIGSLWWSGAIQLKSLGFPIRMVSPEEGCRGWFGGLSLSSYVKDKSLDAAYDYLNWWLDGGPGTLLTRNGAYLANHSAVKARISTAEWDFWYGGQPARTPILDSNGEEIYSLGDSREGGSYLERMGRVVVWDTVMTEHNYLQRRWEQALN